jgi:hypothetical protein
LLAALVAGGVMYAGGRALTQIGIAVGVIVSSVIAFAVIAPRARNPVLTTLPGSEDATDTDPGSVHSTSTDPGARRAVASHRAGKRRRRRRR